jgi:uncharacterized protein YprB with RNaseH-like and TPR domain
MEKDRKKFLIKKAFELFADNLIDENELHELISIAQKAINNKYSKEDNVLKPNSELAKFEILQKSEKENENIILHQENTLTSEDYLEVIKRYEKEFKGKELKEYYRTGREIKNEYGKCFSIFTKTPIKLDLSFLQDKIVEYYTLELEIIPGIRNHLKNTLIEKGYKSINELAKHPKFEESAGKFLEIINKRNADALYDWVLNVRGFSQNKLVFLVSSFYSLEELIFVDIETLGFHGYPLFLIGVGYFYKNTLMIEQFLARNYDEEASILFLMSEKLKDKKAIVSYNGKSFDIPVIKNRMSHFRIPDKLIDKHFDIMYFARTAFKDRFSDFKLITLETELLNVVRTDHIPSDYVPSCYNKYIKTKNIGFLIPIIEHNKQDIISTVKFFEKLYQIWTKE